MKNILGSGKVVLLIVLVGSFITVVASGRVLESSPKFCGSCHEMKESYQQWKTSGASEKHNNCIMCHSGRGISGVLKAQFLGAEMLLKHLTGDIDAEITGRVPESFCLKCHEEEDMNYEHDVEHSINRAGMTCASCHNHKKGNVFFTDM